MQYKLRKFEDTDVDSIAKYANNQNIAKWLTNEFPHPYSKADAEFFIDIVSKEDPTVVFTIEINGEAVGSIAVTPQTNSPENTQIQDTQMNICDKQAELGYWLAEKYWNNGIMTSAIKEMVDYGFKTFDIDCIYATPFKKNTASQKVLKKVGFFSDGKSIEIIKNNETYEVFIFLFERSQTMEI